MAPSKEGWQEIHVGIALMIITTIAVSLRFVARYVKRVKLAIDDWLAIASLIFITSMFIELVLWASIGSNGKHINTLGLSEIQQFFKIFLSQEYTYGISSPLVKLTLLSFYWRLFALKKFRIITNIVAGLTVIWGIITVVVVSLQCIPLEAYWTLDPTATCINSIAFIQGIQGINIFLDLAILIMPMPMVWGLKRPWQDRLALILVFGIGAFVLGASIYRFVALFQLNAEDVTYSIHSGTVWTFVEPCIGLVCACLPMIRGLLPAYKHKQGTGYYGRRPGGGYFRNPGSATPLPWTIAGDTLPASGSHHAEAYIKMNDSVSLNFTTSSEHLTRSALPDVRQQTLDIA